MIVCAWCRKALIDRIHDTTAIHTSCKGCLLVHTVCDRCLANLLRSLDGETVTRLTAEDAAARRSLPNVTLPARHKVPAMNDQCRLHASEEALALPRG